MQNNVNINHDHVHCKTAHIIESIIRHLKQIREFQEISFKENRRMHAEQC
jgi:hypothetical protein